MTDRELLEMAAKAGSVAIKSCTCSDPRWPLKHDEVVSGLRGHWNPFVSDGDALRLAVKLQLTVWNEQVNAGATYCTRDDEIFPTVSSGANEPDVIEADYAATRRAIVLAAAEIGRATP